MTENHFKNYAVLLILLVFVGYPLFFLGFHAIKRGAEVQRAVRIINDTTALEGK